MVEDRKGGPPAPGREPPDDMNGVESSRGSGIIFVLIAIALILAISFFYLTKDRENEQGQAVTEAAESVDSAARVVGDAAQDAANRLSPNN